MAVRTLDEVDERLVEAICRSVVRATARARRSRGLTQRALAERLGCDQSAVSHLEVAGPGVKLKTLTRHLLACGYRPRVVLEPIEEAGA